MIIRTNIREYTVNEFVTVVLEDDNTFIRVNGEEFMQCKGTSFIPLNV